MPNPTLVEVMHLQPWKRLAFGGWHRGIVDAACRCSVLSAPALNLDHRSMTLSLLQKEDVAAAAECVALIGHETIGSG